MKVFCVGLLGIASLLTAGSTMAASAEDTYKSACSTCHDAGIAGAPKLGDKAGWAPRLKQGKDAMYKSALQGKPAEMTEWIRRVRANLPAGRAAAKYR